MATTQTGQILVLLVEDALDLARAIARALEESGYRVVHATDGPSAVDLHTQTEPDVVILDWMLPGLDGLEVLRRIRGDSAVPVLMLTARSEEVDRVVGLELGADDYLAKPFGMRELLARVRALLRRAEVIRRMLAADRDQHVAGRLRRGALRLDPLAHQVWLDNLALDLPPLEFALLHLFLRHPGRVFSRDYLIDTVWQEKSVGGDRAVDNAVARLRKKLGDLGADIETVWGVGYRLRREPDKTG